MSRMFIEVQQSCVKHLLPFIYNYEHLRIYELDQKLIISQLTEDFHYFASSHNDVQLSHQARSEKIVQLRCKGAQSQLLSHVWQKFHQELAIINHPI